MRQRVSYIFQKRVQLFRTYTIIVFTEPSKVDDFEYAHRVHEKEYNHPEPLLVSRCVPDRKRLPGKRPDGNDDEQERDEYRTEPKRTPRGV